MIVRLQQRTERLDAKHCGQKSRFSRCCIVPEKTAWILSQPIYPNMLLLLLLLLLLLAYSSSSDVLNSCEPASS